MKKTTTKILSILLILTLTMANSAFLIGNIIGSHKSYAKDGKVQSKTTNNKNVDFDAFFIDGQNNITHESEIGIGEKQRVYLNVDIKDSGYIKNAHIEFISSSNAGTLNYALSSENNINDKLQKVDGYKLELKQLNVGSFIVEVVVEGTNKDIMPLEYLNQESIVVFKGVYVDIDGIEKEIQKEIKLVTNLKSTYDPKITSGLLGYEIYEESIEIEELDTMAVNTSTKIIDNIDNTNNINNNVENNIESTDILMSKGKVNKIVELKQEIKISRDGMELPIRRTSIETQAPEIDGSKPSSVIVLAKELGYTNGQKDENILFGEENYTYDKETGKLLIEVENKENNGTVWAGNGQDQYIVIYRYENTEITSEVIAKNDLNIKIYTYENTELNYNIVDGVESKVSLTNKGKIEEDIKEVTPSILKGKIYANLVSSTKRYETEYAIKLSATVTNTYGIESIEIETVADEFIGNESYSLNSYYKTIKVLNTNMEKVLGQDGYLIIKDSLGVELGRIDKSSKINKEGYYELDLIGAPESIKIETSKPEKEGTIYILCGKSIGKDLGYNKEELKQMISIISKVNNGEENKEVLIPLVETETRATLSLNKDILMNKEENLSISINLNNNNEKSDLYKNPKFRIELPSYIEDITIDKEDIVFNNCGFIIAKSEIGTNSDGSKYIDIELSGTQTEYIDLGNENSTTIVLNTNIKVKQGINEEKSVKLYYENENVVEYASELEEVNLRAVVEDETIIENIDPITVPTKDPISQALTVEIAAHENINVEFEEYTEEDEEIAQRTEETIIDDNGNEGTEKVDKKFWKEDFYYVPITNGSSVISGQDILYTALIKNITDSTVDNIATEIKIPEGVTFKSATIFNGEEDNSNKVVYNEITRILNINIGSLVSNKTMRIRIDLTVDKFDGNENKKQINSILTVKGEGIEEHSSNQISFTAGNIKINAAAGIGDSAKKYTKDDIIKYSLVVKNLGGNSMDNLDMSFVVPDELQVNELTYSSNNEDITTYVPNGNQIWINDLEIAQGKELVLNMELKVKSIQEAKNVLLNVKIKGYQEALDFDDDGDVISSEVLVYEQELNTNIGLTTPEISNDTTDNYKISGIVWLDENENGTIESTEQKLANIKVKIISAIDKKVVQEAVTGENGEYEFKKLDSTEYIIVFEYDESKYRLAPYKMEGTDEGINSDVIKTDKDMAATDVIKVEGNNISGINMGLVVKEVFDLSLEKAITKIVVQTRADSNTYNFSDSKLAKIEIPAKYLAGSTVLIEYKITIKNEGNIRGKVNKIVDYLPNNITFSSDLNRNWYQGADGNLYNEEFSNTYLNPGEIRTVTLVLRKQMTEDNTGLVNNTAELYEVSNEKDIKDIDSSPANRKQNEDDMGLADAIIGVKTGQEVLYISLALISIIVLGAGMYLIKKKVL